MPTFDTFRALHAKMKRTLYGTLQLACPLCGTRFAVKSTDVRPPSVSSTTERTGTILTFEIIAEVEHVCPEGTVIEAVME